MPDEDQTPNQPDQAPTPKSQTAKILAENPDAEVKTEADEPTETAPEAGSESPAKDTAQVDPSMIEGEKPSK